MYCPKCGYQNADNAQSCAQCGENLTAQQQTVALPVQQPPADRGADIPSYLPHSIICTMYCCPFVGIPAIIYACQHIAKLAAGDLIGAKEASDKSRKWCWITFGVGIGFWTLYGIFIAILAALGVLSEQ